MLADMQKLDMELADYEYRIRDEWTARLLDNAGAADEDDLCYSDDSSLASSATALRMLLPGWQPSFVDRRAARAGQRDTRDEYEHVHHLAPVSSMVTWLRS